MGVIRMQTLEILNYAFSLIGKRLISNCNLSLLLLVKYQTIIVGMQLFNYLSKEIITVF